MQEYATYQHNRVCSPLLNPLQSWNVQLETLGKLLENCDQLLTEKVMHYITNYTAAKVICYITHFFTLVTLPSWVKGAFTQLQILYTHTSTPTIWRILMTIQLLV